MEWIAEVGSCHKGQPALAYRMVKEFAEAGATVIKFQAGHDPDDPVRYADSWLAEAKGWCDDYGVEFLASCWSVKGLELCRSLGMKRRKIAHQQVISMGKMLVNTLGDGLETFISIDVFSALHGTIYKRLYDNPKIKWLSVNTQYPTYHRDFDAESINAEMIGFSNHTPGIAAPLMAITHGASIIECHVTLDPTEASIKDNHFALRPEEFHDMVQIGNQIEMYARNNA
jgi:N,N'-diacetyllegionaminate synthase